MKAVRAAFKGSLLAGVVVAVAASATTSMPARADGSADAAAAQVLFEAGRALVRDGRFSEACPKFAESLQLDRGLGTMLWLADCYEHNGQTASAWAQFKEAAAAAALQKDSREDVARRRSSALEPKLSKLQLAIPAEGVVQGLQVRRDGIVVGASELTLPVPVDPGIHTVTAVAPGRKSWTSTVEVPARPGLLPVTIPVLEVETAAPAGGPAHEAPAPGGAPTSGGTIGVRRSIAIATAGVGVVAIGTGSYFGIHAKDRYDSVTCASNQCSTAAGQTRHGAFGDAAASTVLFAAGGAAFAAAAVVYFTAPKAVTSAGITPAVAPHVAGAVFTRTW